MKIRLFALILALSFATPSFSKLHFKDFKNGLKKLFHLQKGNTDLARGTKLIFESIAENRDFYIIVCDSTNNIDQLVNGIYVISGLANTQECKQTITESAENREANDDIWKNIIKIKDLGWKRLVKSIKPLKNEIGEPPSGTIQAMEDIRIVRNAPDSVILVHPIPLIWKQNGHQIGLMPCAQSKTQANISIVVIEPVKTEGSQNSGHNKFSTTPIAALIGVSIDNVESKVSKIVNDITARYTSGALLKEVRERNEKMSSQSSHGEQSHSHETEPTREVVPLNRYHQYPNYTPLSPIIEN